MTRADRERLKQQVEADRASKVAATPAAIKATPATQEQPKPVPPPRVAILRACGCLESVAQLAGVPCRACLKAYAVARRARTENQRRKKAIDLRGRLPHGSQFEVQYDAERLMWSGTLATTVNGSPVKFVGEASGLFGMERDLDRQYRTAVGVPHPLEAGGAVQDGRPAGYARR
jgi:hypothetical protein